MCTSHGIQFTSKFFNSRAAYYTGRFPGSAEDPCVAVSLAVHVSDFLYQHCGLGTISNSGRLHMPHARS